MTRLNHLGLMQGTTSKLRLLDEAGKMTDHHIVEQLRSNPLVKITGDNMDFYVKTNHQSTERAHKDLHYFVSNIIFSRVATPDLSTSQVAVDRQSIIPAMLLPHGLYLERLQHCYMIILARIISDIPAFSWMKSVIPKHIEHPYAAKMAKKSEVYPLPVMFKNEAKHEDCIDVLDSYEDLLTGYFQEATGL